MSDAAAENGYNPLRWDCEKIGRCFNKYARPKIEVFAECFPGKIAMGDRDAYAEVNFHHLTMEWKSPNQQPTTGQWLAMLRDTAMHPDCLFLVVEGCADIMHVCGWEIVHDGERKGYHKGDLEGLKAWIRAWCSYAENDNTFRDAYIEKCRQREERAHLL